MIRTIISITILCLVFSSFPGCHKETDEDKVKKIIAGIQKAAEEKDIKRILGNISKTYNDPQGNNYENIKGLVTAYFYRFPKISIYIPNLVISVKDSSARAVFQAVLTSRGAAGSAPAVLPESLGVYAFNVLLKQESGEWKVVSASWERVGDAGNP